MAGRAIRRHPDDRVEPFITYSRLPADGTPEDAIEVGDGDARQEPHVGVMPLDRVPDRVLLARPVPPRRAAANDPFAVEDAEFTEVIDKAPKAPRRRSGLARVIVLAGIVALLLGVGVLAGTAVIVMTAPEKSATVATSPAEPAATATPDAQPLASIPASEGTTTVPKSAPPAETATVSPSPAPGASDSDAGWAAGGPAPAPATASAPPAGQGQGKFSDDALFSGQQAPQPVPSTPGANTGVGNDLDFSGLGSAGDADQLVARGRADTGGDPAAANGSGGEGWADIPNEPNAYAVPTVDGLAPNGEMYVGTGNAGWGNDAVASQPPARLLPPGSQSVPLPPEDIPEGAVVDDATVAQPATLGERLRTLFNKPKG